MENKEVNKMLDNIDNFKDHFDELQRLFGKAIDTLRSGIRKQWGF